MTHIKHGAVETRQVEGIADGTRYRLFVTTDPAGGFTWAWVPSTEVIAAGWAAPYPRGEVRVSVGRLSKADRSNVGTLIDVVRAFVEGA